MTVVKRKTMPKKAGHAPPGQRSYTEADVPDHVLLGKNRPTLEGLDRRLTVTQEQVLQLANLVGEVVRRLSLVGPVPAMTVGQAETHGYDCGLNGATEVNCHFSIFSHPENMRAWERGKTHGEEEKNDRMAVKR